MEAAALQRDIDEISVMMYQNREQEVFERMGDISGKLKEVTDALLQSENGREEELVSFISFMYQNLNYAYKHKDMLGMADCLQEYAALAAELYKTKCQAGNG